MERKYRYSRPEEDQQYTTGTSELVVTTPTSLATRHTHHPHIEQVSPKTQDK